jgi:NAD(P)-dependent dehydrogenase (short-subunit alcohol dehydrogenase family)
MAGKLNGKIAIVTGVASGIGQAAALIFAREGAKVVAADVTVEQGEATVRQVKQAGGEAIFVRCDIAKAADAEALVAAAVKAYGRLDCAYNNAGIIGKLARTAEETEENFDRIIEIDLKGPWLCMKYEILQMLRQKSGGAIVNTASAAGLVGSHGMPAYAAAKHGVVGLTRTAALEYAKAGIRINAVCPGIVDTPMTQGIVAKHPRMAQATGAMPIGRQCRPEEIAEAAAWLCSDGASYVTGQAMAVDGGLTAQ